MKLSAVLATALATGLAWSGASAVAINGNSCCGQPGVVVGSACCQQPSAALQPATVLDHAFPLLDPNAKQPGWNSDKPLIAEAEDEEHPGPAAPAQEDATSSASNSESVSAAQTQQVESSEGVSADLSSAGESAGGGSEAGSFPTNDIVRPESEAGQEYSKAGIKVHLGEQSDVVAEERSEEERESKAVEALRAVVQEASEAAESGAATEDATYRQLEGKVQALEKKVVPLRDSKLLHELEERVTELEVARGKGNPHHLLAHELSQEQKNEAAGAVAQVMQDQHLEEKAKMKLSADHAVEEKMAAAVKADESKLYDAIAALREAKARDEAAVRVLDNRQGSLRASIRTDDAVEELASRKADVAKAVQAHKDAAAGVAKAVSDVKIMEKKVREDNRKEDMAIADIAHAEQVVNGLDAKRKRDEAHAEEIEDAEAAGEESTEESSNEQAAALF